MNAEFLLAFKNTIIRELHRMSTRSIYLLSSVGIMTFCFVFFLTFFNDGQPERMPIAVIDNDNSSFSRQFIQNLETEQHLHIVAHYSSIREARNEMQKGNIYAYIHIHDGFYKAIVNGKRPVIVFYTNSAYMVAASLTTKDISYLSMVTTGGIQRQILRAKGVEESRLMSIIQPMIVDVHSIGNPWINYGTYLLNVLLPGMLFLMTIMLTAFCIGIELKEKSSAEWISSANGHFMAALLGKTMPYTIIFSLLGFIGNILLYKFMHFPLHSNIGWMFLASFCLVISGQALGIFIIGMLPILRDAITIAGIFGTLSVTAAGATFPVEQLPYYIQFLTSAFPLRHYFLIYINQALISGQIMHVITEYCIMAAFLILPIFIYHRLKNASTLMNFSPK